MHERGPGEDIIQLDNSNFVNDDEDEEREQLAYYPKVYSGSHAKIPIPTATSIISGKMHQKRQNQKIKHQENYFTDMKPQQ
jgi:hypothetical protein